MEIFFKLFLKIIPLYFIIFLGFIAGRYLNIKKESIASLLIYCVIPIVIFNGIINIKITPATLSIPVLFFLLACLISILSYYFSGFFWKDSTRNILSLMGGSSNMGYFGLPVALALFGEKAIGIIALAILGGSFYNNSFGFFLAAKGKHTTKESLIKMLKLPMLYTFALGIIINLAGIRLGTNFLDMANNFNGAFTVLGMMLIGIGLGEMKKYELDFKFVAVSLVITYIFWPIVMFTVILIDQNTFRFYNHELQKIFMLISILPVAANMVVYSAFLKIQPEKTLFAVMISTLFALIYIPLMAVYFFK